MGCCRADVTDYLEGGAPHRLAAPTGDNLIDKGPIGSQAMELSLDGRAFS